MVSNIGYSDFSSLKNTIYEIEQKMTMDWNVENNRYEQWVLSQRQWSIEMRILISMDLCDLVIWFQFGDVLIWRRILTVPPY